MPNITFGNSYKLAVQKQPSQVQDQRRVRLTQEEIASNGLDDAKLQRLSTTFFESADKASAQGKLERHLAKRGIQSFTHVGPSGTYLITSGPDSDTLSLYHQIRRQNPELCHIDRAREFEDKLAEAGVINPDNNAPLTVKYRLNDNGDGIKLTNKPEIRNQLGIG